MSQRMELPRRLFTPAAGDLTVDRRGVMRLLGYKEGRTQVDERHLALVEQGIGLALEAARPVASVAFCAISVTDETVSTAVPGLTWRSRSLARLLRDSVAVHLVAATLGPGIEERTRELFQQEEYALATIVDAAGSSLIHSLSLYVQAQLGPSTPLYGPGYGDWPITDQIAFTQAAGGPVIELTSTETCYLVPQKSLVGILGIPAPDEAAGLRRSGCSLCTMVDCAYRQRGGSV